MESTKTRSNTLSHLRQAARFKSIALDGEEDVRSAVFIDDLWESDFKETLQAAMVQSSRASFAFPIIATFTGYLLPSSYDFLKECSLQLSYAHIQLSPVTPKIATKQLQQFAGLMEHFRGDIRAALLDTHLASLYPSGRGPLFSRDLEGDLFHMAGHVLHGKGAVEHCMNRELLNAFLQYNMLDFLSDIGSVGKALESFSESESKPWNMHDEEMHGRLPEWTLCSLKPHGGFQPLKKPPYCPFSKRVANPTEVHLSKRI